jgi:hypothetical protein
VGEFPKFLDFTSKEEVDFRYLFRVLPPAIFEIPDIVYASQIRQEEER